MIDKQILISTKTCTRHRHHRVILQCFVFVYIETNTKLTHTSCTHDTLQSAVEIDHKLFYVRVRSIKYKSYGMFIKTSLKDTHCTIS